MINNADAYLFVLDASHCLQIRSTVTAGLKRDHDSTHALERFDSRRVARLRIEQALRARITPAGVAADLSFGAQSSDGTIKHLDHEVRVKHVVRQSFRGQQVNLR